MSLVCETNRRVETAGKGAREGKKENDKARERERSVPGARLEFGGRKTKIMKGGRILLLFGAPRIALFFPRHRMLRVHPGPRFARSRVSAHACARKVGAGALVASRPDNLKAIRSSRAAACLTRKIFKNWSPFLLTLH